ncbi:diguanylate cyclase domain-containing protein [Azohydromonas australica]|uniref:diguanylate cyclase domain-containing protein n=1 Tax=Azohydromonas australica TaxID=364039 RepID=UPI00048B525F|nr:diguanylate cyclase [Azohydromonas australica]
MSTWLALTLLGAVLITALTLSFVIGHFARRHELSQAGAELMQVGWQLRDQLDRGMAERHAEVVALADSELLRSLADPSLIRDALQTLQRKVPLCTWIGVADSNGRVLAATGGLLEGQNVSSRPWFQAGARGPFAGDVHNAVLLERLLPPQAEPWRFVDLAAPVVVGGTTRAVVGAHLSWEWARDIEGQLLAPVMRDQGIQTFIVQRDGQVLLGPDGSVGKKLDAGVLAAATGLAGAVTAWPGEGEYVTAVVDTQGRSSYPGLGWRVVVRQPPVVALDRYAALHQQLVLATVGVILLMAALSPLAGRRLAAPLAQITSWLRDPQAPTSLSLRGHSYKEAHWLLAALMAARARLRTHAHELEQLNAGLEQRVNERTQELHRSREDLQTVADNLPALVALVDRELCYRFVNEAYRHWWGVKPETLLGSSMRDLVGEPNFVLLQPYVQQVLSGRRVTFEQEMPLAEKARFVEVTYVPNHDEQGGVDGFMVLVYDVTERKKLELQFAHAAHHDALTGMPNRRRLMELLTLSMLRTQRLGCPLVLLFLDLDGFKAVNDNHGHEAGDALLQVVAQRLRQSVRRTDTVARLAGDEFVVLLECMPDASHRAVVVDKIHAALRAPVVLPSGIQASVGASIGTAEYRGERHVSAEQLLAQADAAMYEAKRAARGYAEATKGSGRTVIFHS